MDSLLVLKVVTAIGSVMAFLVFYKNQRALSVLGIALIFAVALFYYSSNPADFEFVKRWGRPLAISIFSIIDIDLLIRYFKGVNYGN